MHCERVENRAPGGRASCRTSPHFEASSIDCRDGSVYGGLMKPRFYFACCQVGAEKAVKAEVLERHPQLRFAFSRPGFITFKEEDDRNPPIQKAPGIFVRHWGQSLGQAKDFPALLELLKTVPDGAVVHPFERDT